MAREDAVELRPRKQLEAPIVHSWFLLFVNSFTCDLLQCVLWAVDALAATDEVKCPGAAVRVLDEDAAVACGVRGEAFGVVDEGVVQGVSNWTFVWHPKSLKPSAAPSRPRE